MFRRKLLLCVLLVFLTITNALQARDLTNQLNPNEELKMKWKQKVGLGTYRTTLQSSAGLVFAPSNGKSTKKQIDSRDGVYVLNGKNGEVLQHLTLGKYGDRDVNGLAISASKLVFGTDERYLAAYDWNWELKWVVKAGGDFESAPLLTHINYGADLDVVATTQAGEVIAIDGETGDLIWKFKASSYDGRPNFPEKGFYAAPLAVDINQDSIADILVADRNGSIYALNGSDGALLWKHYSWFPSGFLASPVAKDQLLYFLESHGYLHTFNFKGRLIQRIPLFVESWPTMVASPIFNKDNQGIVIGSTFKKKNRGVVNYPSTRSFSLLEIGKISASTVIANVRGDEALEQVMLSEAGQLLIYNDDNELLASYKLKDGGETTPLIADADDDGKLELLLLLNDGYLYCYDLETKGPVYFQSFRANPYNTGKVNDVLHEDISEGFSRNDTLFKQDSALQSYDYKTWYSVVKDPYLIDETGIGHAKIGMTLAQFKRFLNKEYRLKEFDFEDNLKVLGIVFDNEVQYYLSFSSQREISDSSRIKRVLTSNPDYSTKEGIRPGDLIRDIEQHLGAPTLFYSQISGARETVRFPSQEPWQLFYNYSEVKAGQYKASNQFNQTKQYNKLAVLQFIGVK